MSHLLAYENAKTELGKALAALVVVERKNSKRLAWNWAITAAEHATNLGVQDAEDLLGDGRWPEIEPLRQAIAKV